MNYHPESCPPRSGPRSPLPAALVAFSFLANSSAAMVVYDAATDFSINNGNPNSVWTYGYRTGTLGTGLTLFPAANLQPNGLSSWYDPAYNPLGTPSFAANLTSSPIHAAGMTWPPGRLSFHPSPIHDTVLRWTAPSSGEWDLSATFLGMDSGTTNVYVLRNGTDTLYNSTRSGTGGNAGPYVAKLTLGAGETIEFVVNNAGSYFNDTTGLDVVITGSCTADFNQDGGIDGADVEAFFIAWEGGEGAADVNGDGGIDGQDVQFFFERWEQGLC